MTNVPRMHDFWKLLGERPRPLFIHGFWLVSRNQTLPPLPLPFHLITHAHVEGSGYTRLAFNQSPSHTWWQCDRPVLCFASSACWQQFQRRCLALKSRGGGGMRTSHFLHPLPHPFLPKQWKFASDSHEDVIKGGHYNNYEYLVIKIMAINNAQ